MTTADPILYSFRRCPYAMRARAALAISATRCELREVKLAAKPAQMLTASPKGTVPVLVLTDGTVIAESIDIMRWALARNDPEGWLLHDDAALIARNDGAFKHALDRYKYPERYSVDPLVHREHAIKLLRELDERLSASGYLCGSAWGLADAAIAPFVRQFASVDRPWFDSQRLARLRDWLDSFVSSELFAQVMARVPVWSTGEPRVFFPLLQDRRDDIRR